MNYDPNLKANPVILQSEELYDYILETNVYPREPAPLKELREASASHPRAFFGTNPDAGQLMAMLLKLVNAKKTIEIGVFTGYSLLLTALNIPKDGQIIAIDIDREAYNIGEPIIKKSGVSKKINFIESPALPILDKLLEEKTNLGTFDFAFVDADKNNYANYHERLMKLVKVGGLLLYDNTLWGGAVAKPEDQVPENKRRLRKHTIDFNAAVTADDRVELCHVPCGDGLIICRRLC
ncbi:hypothetical protein Nepgr_025629 [Nepenthes gracilis]|uniref:Caffeoyl-CoA O-methyltransferase n=1 Tax=Nepenthes gracilis TaxID=150966 RepID=A0AAD3T726_NEPGR|nr:hypothetical protein Nepgr_025629 [Nepenthes gracilis]